MRKAQPPLIEAPVSAEEAQGMVEEWKDKERDARLSPKDNGAHAEREHALCSASGASRWTVCTGSVALCELVPRGKGSKYAEEGTKAHELLEKFLAPIVFHWNKTGDCDWNTVAMMDFAMFDNYPREMWDHVVEFARLIYENLKAYKPKKIFTERKVFLLKKAIIPGRPESRMFGTADIFYAFRDPQESSRIILAVWDLKYGKGKVVDAGDLQFPYYAAAVAEEFPKIKFDEFWLNVYQPRAEHEEGIHRQQFVSAKEMLKTKKFLIKQANAALAQIGKPIDQLDLVASADGKGHCQFCDAMAVCPAYQTKINEAAGMDFADDPELLLPTTDDFQSTANQLIEFDKERYSKLLQIKPLVKKFFATLETTGINFLLSGGELPGWKVVETQGRRKFKEETGDVARGLKKLGVKDPYDHSLRGLGSIEAELYAIGKSKTKVGAKKLLEPFVEKSQGGYSLAEEDDSRPRALGHEKAANAFDVVDTAAFEEFEE